MAFLAKLGDVTFSLKTFEFDDFERKTSWDWQTVPVLGKSPRYHFGELLSDNIVLKGLSYYSQGSNQREKVAQLRKQAASGRPVAFFYASERAGQYLGLWVIKSISDKRSSFSTDGRPEKIEFSVEIEKYSED